MRGRILCFLCSPMISWNGSGHNYQSDRECSELDSLRRPAAFHFPRESNTIDIGDDDLSESVMPDRSMSQI
jgi:hypothetical protein